MATPLTIFPDTNILLQCRPLQELPWTELGDHAEYHIVIAPTVLQELDKHSHDGNSRRSKRSKAAIALIDKVVISSSSYYIVREASPRLTVSLGDHPPENAALPYPLDKSFPDHRILFEFISFAQLNPSAHAVYLTIDRAMSALAKKLNVPFRQAPDGWRLPPEQSADDKRIKALETEVQNLKAEQPDIQLSLLDRDGVPFKDDDGIPISLPDSKFKGTLSATIRSYPQLSESQVDTLVAVAQEMYPRVTDFPKEPSAPEPQLAHLKFFAALTASGNWEPPSDDAIAKYRDKFYPQWGDDVKTWASGISAALDSTVNFFYLRVALSNIGGVPAKTTIIEFNSVPDTLLIASPNKRHLTADGPPRPPIAPTGRVVHWADRFGSLRLEYPFATSARTPFSLPNFDMQKRDPHAFYLHGKSSSAGESKRAFICDSFRHKVDAKEFGLLLVSSGPNRPVKGALRIRVTADNLPIPVNVTLPFDIAYETFNTFDKAKELLRTPRSDADDPEED